MDILLQKCHQKTNGGMEDKYPSKLSESKNKEEMASFVREVLTASGRLGEKEDFGGKASRLKLRVDDLKSNLRERIESRYEDFAASFNDVSIAVVQLENVIHEVEALENSVNTHLKVRVF